MILQHYAVTGKVQGVGFRAFVRAQAQTFAASGWVRNLTDGRVEVLARVPELRINEFKEMLLQGPKYSDVLDLQCLQVSGRQLNFNGFEIESDSEDLWQGL